jgi:hypothetical protein
VKKALRSAVAFLCLAWRAMAATVMPASVTDVDSDARQAQAAPGHQ